MQMNLCFERGGRAWAALVAMLFLSAAAWGGMDNLADWPGHAGALRDNLALAANLSPSSVHPSDVAQQPTSLEHPFSYAYFKVLGAAPSVDGRISDLHPPKVFFAWGEKHSPHESVSKMGECSVSEWEIGQNGSAWLNGTMTWSLDGQNYTMRVENGSEDPLEMNVPAAAWAGLTVRRAADGSPRLPNLTMTFDGVVGVQYRHREKVENSGRAPNQGGMANIRFCGPGEEKIDQRNYTVPVNFSRTYEVETGEPLLVLLQPVDLEQLEYAPKLQAAALLSRQPQRIQMGAGELAWAQANFSQYYPEKDEFGFMSVRRLPKEEDRARYATSGPLVRTFANSSHAYLQPGALDGQNRSFAWQYYMRVQMDESVLPPGEANATVFLEDEFGDGWSALWTVRTRRGCGIGGSDADHASVRCLDNGTLPAMENGGVGAGPDGADGGVGGGMPPVVSLGIAGDDALRPARKDFVVRGAQSGAWLLAVPLAGALVLAGLVLRREW